MPSPLRLSLTTFTVADEVFPAPLHEGVQVQVQQPLQRLPQQRQAPRGPRQHTVFARDKSHQEVAEDSSEERFQMSFWKTKLVSSCPKQVQPMFLGTKCPHVRKQLLAHPALAHAHTYRIHNIFVF